MALVDKTIFCFCHWGGENVVGTDGSASYVGGITDQFIVNSGIKYDAFVRNVFDRLGIEPSGKKLHFSVKFNKTQLIRLKDQDGVDNMIRFNDDFAHVYVSNYEVEAVAAPVMDSTRISTTEVDAHQILHLEERHVSRDHSASIPVTNSSNDVTSLATAKWSEILMGEGQAFENADAFRQAVFKYALARQFNYKYLNNAASYMRVRCTVDGCPWKVSAGLEAATGRFSIKRFVDSHTHSPLDPATFKPKFKSKMMRDMIQEKILGSPSYQLREVCEDTKRNFAVTLTYHQAWTIKKNAKEAMDEKMEDSYKLIPWLCNRLTEAMPGTIATWSCTEDNKFKQLFVSYECLIRGFHVGCRPLIFIDVYPMLGPYRGTLLLVSALDADNGMYPFAYGVVTSENEDNWLWFLEHLKLVVRDREVAVVSDRNPLILSGVDKIFGEDNCAHCFHCVQESFKKFIDTNRDFKVHGKGKEIALRYLNDIAYARTLDMYNDALAKLCTFRKELYDWVIANGPEHWSNALFKKPRWDWLKSNATESFDALIGEAKLLHIPEMMVFYHEKLSQMLLNNKCELEKWKLPFGPHIEGKILENQKLGNSLVASIQSDFEVEVQECHEKEVVNLKLGTCTCLEWQMTGIPCRHACSAIALANIDLYQCVTGWYKREVQERIYAEVMHSVPKIDIPHPDEVGILSVQMVENGSTSRNNVVLSPCPPRSKRTPGRPRKHAIKPRILDKKRMRCSRCRDVGHNRKNCKKTL